MKVIMSHPTGNSNVRAVAASLCNASLLAEFNTTLAINAHSKWIKLLPASIKSQILRRQYFIDNRKIKIHPYREMARMILPKIGLRQFVSNEYSWASIDTVYRNLDRTVSKRLKTLTKLENCRAVYAYEDGALNTFQEAKKLGLTCIYDLPIAYWKTGRRLMMEESLRLPNWAPTLAGGISDSNEKLERKDEELSLADIIVAPGSFVASSLPLWSKNKLLITAPFGSPEVKMDPPIESLINTNKLRVLFVGSMTQRKGLGDLFEAIKILNNWNIELIVMGTPIESLEFYFKILPNFIHLTTRPHDQVLSLMRSCDVFCLPSIVEGRALVMQEAMSQQLPLIITPNTGGEDLIIEGKTGFIVPIRSPQAIAEKIQWFIDHRDKVKEMGEMAQVHAAKYTWKAYGEHIVSNIRGSI